MQTFIPSWSWPSAFLLVSLLSCSDTKDCALTASCAESSGGGASSDASTKGGKGGDEPGNSESGNSSDDAGPTSAPAPKQDASVVGIAPDAGPGGGPVIVFGECGDGLLATGEACDDGREFNQGKYGGCNPDCTLAPFCGDKVVSAGESCDPPSPVNDAGVLSGDCSASCGVIERCGDEKRTGDEECDFGDAKNTGEYGGCTSACGKAPYCGDGQLDADREACDRGAAGNDGAYGGCQINCTLAPRCGDGKVSSGEQCDLGDTGNTGAYGGCTAQCKNAPYCGDGKVSNGEQCDLGDTGNTGAYGGCTAQCKNAPYCGDGEVSNGEQCDLGTVQNTGDFGGCESDCKNAPLCNVPGGQTQCGNQCYNLTTDVNHCGACDGAKCSAPSNGTAQCSNSGCGFTCQSLHTKCGNECLNLASDVNHCGNSCNAPKCTAPANGTATCSAGACGFTCASGLTPCGAQCRNYQTDANNCGACGQSCQQNYATASCNNGTCNNTCTDTNLMCNGADGKPTCGTWDFESGTEGWKIDPVQGAPNAWSGVFETSTKRFTSGTRSLVIGMKPVASGSTQTINLELQLCPGSKPATVAGRNFVFDIYPETGVGSTPFREDNGSANYVFSVDGEEGLDFYPKPDRWTTITLPFLEGTTSIGMWIRLSPDQNWTGRWYIDNMRFE